jgi:hypothetical protein
MNADRFLIYFGAAFFGAVLLVVAMFFAIHTHEMRITFGASATTNAQSSSQYVQLPTCFWQSQCPWLDAAPADLPSLTIEYESECENMTINGRIPVPTHAELNWIYNKSTKNHLCPNF